MIIVVSILTNLSFKPTLRLTSLDEFFWKFESEAIARMNLLTEFCTSNANLSDVCTLCNKFRRWINFSSRELEFLCLKDNQRNFYARFYGIVEPLLQKVPPTLLLSTPEVEVHPPLAQETAIVTSSGTHKSAKAEGSGSEPIPLVLKTLQELKQENEVLRTQLDKQIEMFKE